MAWTDERVELLKKRWTEGKSAAEIAKELGEGVTRNAVIGKAHRMGLSGRPSPIKKKKTDATPKTAVKKKTATKTAVKAEKPPSPAVTKRAAAAAMPIAAPTMAPVSENELANQSRNPAGGIALLEVTDRKCRWPVGDPRDADFHFCGAQSPAGIPYCVEHASIAYQSAPARGAKRK